MGGKKKGKGGKDTKSAGGVLDDGRGLDEGKKSRRKKKDIEEDYDDELAELVTELGLGGDNNEGTQVDKTASETTGTTPSTSETTPSISEATSTSVTAQPGSVAVDDNDNTGSLRQDSNEGPATSKKAKKKKKAAASSAEQGLGEIQQTHNAGLEEVPGEMMKLEDKPQTTTQDNDVTSKEDKKKKKKKKKLGEEKNSAGGGPANTAVSVVENELVQEKLSSDSKTNLEEGTATSVKQSATGGEGVVGATEEGDEDGLTHDEDKKKKKKKKKKEEEKKASKGPGKSAISKIKKMQAALEEEKLRREREALEELRAEEEREKARLEKIRLEKERKERQKQKDKERKERRKKEGKPVTKKEKEAESRRLAQLAALEEQGIVLPEKGAVVLEKKKVKYGSRQRTKKVEAVKAVGGEEVQNPEEDRSIDSEQEEGQEERLENTVEDGEPKDTNEGVASWEDIEDTKQQEVESWEELEDRPAQGVESWEDLDSDDKNKSSEVGGASSSQNTEDVEDRLREVSRSHHMEEQENDEGEEEEEEEDGEDDSSDSSSDEEESGLSPADRAKLRIQRRRQRHAEELSSDTLRSPVVCVLGHVDTGKTKILDKIRRTNVQDGEAGGITQQIGATFVPVEAIKEQTKMLKEFSKAELTLPGLLIIDTPGHESFSNLRMRGSSMCDLAILVVDIMHGLEAQTKESLNLLKKGNVPFVVALNKVDRLYDWHRNPTSSIRDTLKKQKQTTRDQLDARVREVTREFNEEGLNVAMFWEKVDFKEYLPMIPTSAITGDGMGDLIALLVHYSVKNLVNELRLSMEVEALVMEVKVVAGLGTTIDVILRNGLLREGDVMILSGNEGPFVATVRALLMPQPLRELRVKNAYVSHSAVMAAQGIKVTAKGDLEKTLPGTNILIAKRPDEIEVLKEEAAVAMKNVLNAIKLQDRGVYVQASTLGSLEALLEFLKQSKIPYSGINIGPVHKRDVMKASVMLEHDSQWAVILAFDVRIERDAQEMADSQGVKIFSADIIYHLFDAFLQHREELKEKNRQLYRSIAVFPCRLRILPNCIFNSRDPIVIGVVVEAGIVKPGTPLTVPSKGFTDIGVITSLEVNHKTVDSVRKGTEVCVKIEAVGGEAPRLYGRHFDHTDMLVSKVSRESIDAVKNYFREDLNKSDWQLIIELKRLFQII